MYITAYHHVDIDHNPIDLPVGKVVCVGQNYADHIKEMNSKPLDDEALLFIKPNTAVVHLAPQFSIPANRGECHNETELAILISQPLSHAVESQVADAIWGYGVALDLTLRDLQSKAKQAGRPWERAKAFDGACPLSPFVQSVGALPPENISLALTVNGAIRQHGHTENMIRGITALIAEISQTFTLLPGDVVLTGTPAGVAPLYVGDKLRVSFDKYVFSTQVV